MDFFTHQDVARKKTSLLVFYFFVAVALIVAAVYLAVMTIFVVGQAKMGKPKPGEQVSRPIGPEVFWNPQLLLWVAGGTVAVIALGTLYKMGSLRGGGETVARMLGGRPIDPSTQDLDERVLLNVVEEMAIASGTPVPPVFLLDEGGINAFAAGWSPNNAVIGVTRGTIETLTRDELQGVIAHEFSHILNGDMRLNIRLMGVLHGILLIALIGYGIFRSLRYARVSSSSSNKKGGGAALIVAMLALGVAFLIIGYVGVFFGKLIKSAVSRQREFLADASAVQFTRNPGGISGALKKIGGFAFGSRLKDEMAEEASHMFFGNAVRASFLNLLSTHPPLDVRIKRVEPTFDGEFPEVNRVRRTARDLHREDVGKTRERQTAAIQARAAGKTQAEARAAAFAFAPEAVVASVGTLDAEHVDYAAGLVASIPERLMKAVHEPLGAIAAVYCLLLDDDANVRRSQIQSLSEHADRAAHQEVQRLIPVMDQVAPEARLPLVDMAIPALCQLSGVQYRKFCETVHYMVEADEKINIFEFALERMMMRHLAPHFVKRKPLTVKYTELRPLLPMCSCLLATLAHAGNRDADAAARAYAQGADKLSRDDDKLGLLPREQCGFKALDQAFDRLAEASPQIKKRVLEACAACIDSDGRVTIEEAELLRVIADSLDCPMPPLLASHVA